MIDTQEAIGKLIRKPGAVEAVIEREFDAPPARLWDALTDPAMPESSNDSFASPPT